jgi:hypothetical protein
MATAAGGPVASHVTAAGSLESWFDGAAAEFADAAAKVGPGPDCSLRIACSAVSLSFAGPALEPIILPALRHLRTAAVPVPDLAVHLWSWRQTGSVLAPPPWDLVDFHERGNTRAWHDERFTLSYDRRTDVFSAVDTLGRRAVYWTRDAETLPNYTAAAPMHRLLQGWLRTRGSHLLHAASIGYRDGALLLAGRSGSGKSTTAMLAFDSDLLYAGDDFALVQEGPEPLVHGLYSTAKLNRDGLDRMPALWPRVSNPSRLEIEKALVYLDDCDEVGLLDRAPLRAIVLPHVADREDSAAAPVSPFDAYRTIGPDTAFTILGDGRHLLATIRDLVNRVPCFELALGRDPEGVRAALREILSSTAP